MINSHPVPLFRSFLIPCLLLTVIGAGGCEGGQYVEGAVTGEGVALDELYGALDVDSVMAIIGTYGPECTDRTGSWAVALNGYQLVSAETQLSVVLSDDLCTLFVTEVKAGSVGAPLSYMPASPVLLTAGYERIGVAFMLNGLGATQAYANFRVLPDLSFSEDFVVEMVYSADINKTDLTLVTGYSVTQVVATASGIPAPDATMSLVGLHVTVDAKNKEKTTTGSAALTQGSIVGESYVVDFDTLDTPPSYPVVDAAFNSITKTPVSLTGTTFQIPAAQFNMTGVDLTNPVVRNVIVSNIEDGVNSYQVFKITIQRPDKTRPTVLSTVPANSANNVVVTAPITATFSEAMNPATITTTSFTLKKGGSSVTGTVTYVANTATFTPATSLAANSNYTATITKAVTDVANNSMSNTKTWNFTTK